VMRGLDDLVRAGKVLYIGVSDTPAWIVSQANTMAALRGWTPFVALQIKYSLLERTVERDLMPMADAFDLAVTPWGVLGGGVLTGKYNQGKGKGGRVENEAQTKQQLAMAARVMKIAHKAGCSPSQVALNWVRQQPGLIIPIIGARTVKQVKDNIGSLDHQLTRGQLASLDKVSRVEPGFPHEFLAKDNIRDIIFGGTQDMVDNHRG